MAAGLADGVVLPWATSFQELAALSVEGVPLPSRYRNGEGALFEALVVLARDGGALVALPVGALDLAALGLGPHTELDVPMAGVRGGALRATVRVALVDLPDGAFANFEEVTAEPAVGFEPRGRQPHMLGLVRAALEWVHGAEEAGGTMRAYVDPLEAFVSAESDVGGGPAAAAPGAARAAPAEGGSRTAAEETALATVLSTISSRLEALERDRAFGPWPPSAAPPGGAGAGVAGGETPRLRPAGFDPRPVFGVSAAMAERGLLEARPGERPLPPSLLTDVVRASPGPELRRAGVRTAASAPGEFGSSWSPDPAAMRAPRPEFGAGGGGDLEADEEADEAGPMVTLLRAVQAQTVAMNKLLARDGGEDDMLGLGASSSASVDGPVPTGVRGALQRERLQNILENQPGAFAAAVRKNMKKRMGLDTGALESSAPDPYVYMERYGGYQQSRQLGLIAWLLSGVLRAQWSGRHEAASDQAALLMVVLEQAALDGGQMDLAWLLSLQEEPPHQIFAKTAAPATAMGRSFTPLASQSWTTVAMAFLKELDTLQTRRADIVRQRPGAFRRGGGGEGGEAADQKAQAKKGAKPKKEE